MNRLYFDIETRSTVNLLDTGVYPYALDCDILCLVYRYKGRYKVYIPMPKFKAKIRSKLLVELDELQKDFDEADELVAHNANFERIVCNAHGLTDHYKIKKFKCTAAKAAYHGLPRSLEAASKALALGLDKDMGGRTIMLKMSKPKRNKDGSLEWVEDEHLFIKLVKYCITDVQVTVLLDEALPDLPPIEANIYALDQKINDKGIPVNVAFSHKLKSWVADKEAELLDEFKEVTGGMVTSPRQRDNSIRWLEANGVKTENLQAPTVDKLLARKRLPDIARRFLTIRKILSKSSTSKHNKYISMEQGGLIKGTLLYYGAATGRFSGRGVQVQNLPRDVYEESELDVIENLNSKEEAEFFTGDDAHKIASRCVRGVIKTPEGYVFAASDYSAIESRVLAWVVEDHRILKAYKDGLDIYKINASNIFSVPYEAVTKPQRQVGKVAELALGYQGWVNAFLVMADSYDLEVDGEEGEERLVDANKLIKDVVLAWREDRPLVKNIWHSYEQAAVDVIREGGTKKVGKVIFRREVFGKRKYMSIELPAGRKLYYPKVSLSEKEHYGRKKVVINYYKTFQGKFIPTRTYGGQLVENVVQAVSRDLLCYAMILGYKKYMLLPNFTVHDEQVIVLPIKSSVETVKNIEKVMESTPPWATGLPLNVETNVSIRYGK